MSENTLTSQFRYLWLGELLRGQCMRNYLFCFCATIFMAWGNGVILAAENDGNVNFGDCITLNSPLPTNFSEFNFELLRLQRKSTLKALATRDYKKAEKCSIQSLTTAQNLSKLIASEVAVSLVILGDVYKERSEFDRALIQYQLALKKLVEAHDEFNKPEKSIELAMVVTSIADIYFRIDKEKARISYSRLYFFSKCKYLVSRGSSLTARLSELFGSSLPDMMLEIDKESCETPLNVDAFQ